MMNRIKWAAFGLLVASLTLNVINLSGTFTSGKSGTVKSDTRQAVVMQTPGGLLEVSTITAEERFENTSNHTILGVPIAKTIAQIRVPTVYRYHIQLAKEWKFVESGGSLIVIAPPVQPSLPVAIDTSKLESFSAGLWSPFTGTGAISSLQRSITPELEKKARTDSLITLQRESARKTVTEFVQKWVIQQPQWPAARRPLVIVFFADEPLGLKAAPLLKNL
jgi:hypothetical protein